MEYVFPFKGGLQDALEVASEDGSYASEKALERGTTNTYFFEPEFELAKTLAVFPERVSAAIADYEPSCVTRYTLDLAAAFNRFYHECKIANCEDEGVKQNRVALTSAARRTLKTALGLICMKTPEKI